MAQPGQNRRRFNAVPVGEMMPGRLCPLGPGWRKKAVNWDTRLMLPIVMMLEAILPSGQKQVISLVSDFNFNWMTTYVYADDAAPLLAKGTILKVTAWHDNTTAKKSNPDPNQWVGWGDRTVGEMAHAWINIVYMKEDDFKLEQRNRRATLTTSQQQ